MMRLFDRWHAVGQNDDADLGREMADLSVPATGPDIVDASEKGESTATAATDLSTAALAARRRRPAQCLPLCRLSICSLAVLCSLGMAMVVFMPWFMIEVEPDYALEARMTHTSCLVLAHEIIATKPTNGNTVLLYMPGLCVSFDVNGANTSATALPRLKSDVCWMSGEVMRDYFDKRPVGHPTTCYYDSERPTERVVTEDGIDDIGHDLLACLAMSIITLVASLCLFGLVAGLLLGFLGDPLFQ